MAGIARCSAPAWPRGSPHLPGSGLGGDRVLGRSAAPSADGAVRAGRTVRLRQHGLRGRWLGSHGAAPPRGRGARRTYPSGIRPSAMAEIFAQCGRRRRRRPERLRLCGKATPSLPHAPPQGRLRHYRSHGAGFAGAYKPCIFLESSIPKVPTVPTTTVNVSFQRELLAEIDAEAKREARSRSELLREAARMYVQRQRRWESLFALGDEATRTLGTAEGDVSTEIAAFREERRTQR